MKIMVKSLSMFFLFLQTVYASCPVGCPIPDNTPVGPSVPFTNQILNPNQIMFFPYNFGQFTSMVCYTPNFTPSYLIGYTLGGCFMPCTQLPVVLTTIPNTPNTKFADKQSRLAIKNTSNTAILVSCEYGF